MKPWLDVVHGIAWEPNWRAVSGPVHLVDGVAEAELVDCLTVLGFEVVVLDVSNVHDERSMFDVMASAFAFPAYFGKNWDAFNDSFGEICDAREEPLAIVWRNAASMCDRTFPEFLQAVAMMSLTVESAQRRPIPLQIEVFWLGSQERGYVARPRGVRK